MPSIRQIRWLFGLLLFVCFSHAAYYYKQLPAQVPSHFAASGHPDAWSGKDVFVGLYVFTIGICGVAFGSIGAVIARLPVSLINLPNKNFWLADERKEETISYLGAFMLLFGSATLGLLFFTFHQAFRVSLGRITTLEYMPFCIAFYLVISMGLAAGLLVKYCRQPR